MTIVTVEFAEWKNNARTSLCKRFKMKRRFGRDSEVLIKLFFDGKFVLESSNQKEVQAAIVSIVEKGFIKND